MTKIQVIINALQDINAFDIIVYDMKEISPFFDYFVISSASSDRQLNAAISHISNDLAKEGLESPKVEGKDSRSWILVDAGDVIVNVFTKEEREYYNLEKMWAGIETVDIEKLKWFMIN